MAQLKGLFTGGRAHIGSPHKIIIFLYYIYYLSVILLLTIRFFNHTGAASCQEESVPPIHQEDQVLPNQARTKSTNPCPVLSGSILSVPSLPCTSKSQTEAPAPQKKVVGAVEESVPEEVPAGGGFSSGAITTMASPSDVVGSRSRVRKKMTLTSSEFVRMVNMYDKCAERQQLSGLLGTIKSFSLFKMFYGMLLVTLTVALCMRKITWKCFLVRRLVRCMCL